MDAEPAGSRWAVVAAFGGLAAVTQMVWLTFAPVTTAAAQAEGTASGLIWLAGNLGGLVVASVVGFTTDAPAVSYLLLAALVVAALPLVGRLRAPVAALPPIEGLGEPSAMEA